MEQQYYGTGRRKRAVARVYLRPGTGKILINRRELDSFFGRDVYKFIVKQPLEITEQINNFDVLAFVKGGGTTGQAGALCHGISRALLSFDENTRPALRSAGFLTRDARKVERKKYGQRGARARFQYSKR